MRKRLIRLCAMVMAGVMLAGCGNSGAGGKNGANKENNEGKQSGGKETYDVYMQTVETDEYIYDEYTNHIELFKYKGEDVEWKVPSQINGKDVTVLGKGLAMLDLENDLEKVIIPDTVSEIGALAFDYCEKITEISIPDSVKEIGAHAFEHTKWYDNLTDKYVIVGDGVLIKYNGEEEELIIPNGVKCISYFCALDQLRGGEKVKKISLPEGLEVIKENAFNYYMYWNNKFSDVEEINIPDSVKKIGDMPGSRSKLPQYFNAEGVVVGDGVFLGYWLDEDDGTYVNEEGNVTYPDGVKHIYYTGGSIENCNSFILPDTYVGCATHAFAGISENIENIIVPEGVKILGPRMFEGSNSKHISLPDGLVAIENYSLSIMDNLEDLIIPASVVSIGRLAVSCCTSLKELTLNEGLLYIGQAAFSGCSALTEVRIPSSVKIIGKRAFDPGVTIKGVAGSEAERFAKENGNVFVVE